jgi:hypothetical protein
MIPGAEIAAAALLVLSEGALGQPPTGPVQATGASQPAGADRDQELRHPKVAAAIVGGIYGSLSLYTYLAWYRRSENSPSLHFRDEGWFGSSTYAGGADKLGHLWTNYALTRATAGILQWGGYSRRAAVTTSVVLAAAFSLGIELKDGYEPQYGFSAGDLISNLAGEALTVAMVHSPRLDEMFDLRLEYRPSPFFIDAVEKGGPLNVAEDYSGQRFLVAYHLASVVPLRESRYLGWTQWLDLTVGYQALHFQPAEIDTNARVQRLFLGVSLNVQRLLDWATGTPGPSTRAARMAAELVAVPYTTLELGHDSRGGRARGESQR